MSGENGSQAERIAALEARILNYEVEARRTVGDLFRLREAFERRSRRDSDGTLLDEMQLALTAIQGSRFLAVAQTLHRCQSAHGACPEGHVG